MQSNGLINYGKVDKYDDKHIYYNATIANPSSEYKVANFVDQRSQAILDNQSNYHVSVIRFSIPGSAIPIFNFPNIIGSGYNNFNFVLNLQYQGNNFNSTLIFINLNDFITDKGVFSYQNFIDSINAGFQQSFTELKSSFPSAPQTLAPYLTLDEATGLISLNVQRTYDPFVSGNNVIKIFFNQKLFAFFESFNVKFNGVNLSNATDVQFIVENKGNNLSTLSPIPSPEWNSLSSYQTGSLSSFNGLNYESLVDNNRNHQPDTSPLFWQVNYFIPSQWNILTSYSIGNVVYDLGIYYVSLTNANLGNVPSASPANWQVVDLSGYKITQESNTLYLWNELRSILFTTGTITVRSESVPTLNSSGDVLQVNNNSLKILTDFEPQSASPTSGGSFKNYFQYYPQGPYRLLDLTGTRELTYIDFQIFCQNSLGVITPLLIPPNQSVSVKIMFMKKTAKINNESLSYN